MISFKQKGDWKATYSFLERAKEIFDKGELNKYGEQGVAVLRSATPMDSGKTANSWYYTIERKGKNVSIVWSNSHTKQGYNIAILIQYGHGTHSGYYVQGVDYINPAMKPVFDNIAEEVWREVIK